MDIEVDNVEDFLAHYGIKGMRWGVRREVGPDGLVTEGGFTRAKNTDPNKAEKIHMFTPGGKVVTARTSKAAGNEYIDRLNSVSGQNARRRSVQKILNKNGDKLLANLYYREKTGKSGPSLNRLKDQRIADWVDQTLNNIVEEELILNQMKELGLGEGPKSKKK